MSPITSALHSSRVVIDCSSLCRNDKIEGNPEVASLVDWVRSFPRRSDIHVVLGSGRTRHASRKLQGKLQALGCMVSARHVVTA